MAKSNRIVMPILACLLLIGAKAPTERIAAFSPESASALLIVVHPAELSRGMLEFHFREYNPELNKFESIRMGRNGAYGLGGRRLDIPELASAGFYATVHLVPASRRVPSIIRADFTDSSGLRATYVHCFRDSTPVYDLKAGRAYYLEIFDSENLKRRREGVATGITRGGKLVTVDARATTLFDAKFDDDFDEGLFAIAKAHVTGINSLVDLEMARPENRLMLKGQRGRVTQFATESGCSEVSPDRAI